MNRNERVSKEFLTKCLAYVDEKDLAKALMVVSVDCLRNGRAEDARILKGLSDTIVAKVQAEVDLSNKSNLTETRLKTWKASGQREQRNLRPGSEGVEEMLDEKVREGDLGKCSRFCRKGDVDIQGRNCRVCKGAGFNAHRAIQNAQNKGTSIHAPVERTEGARV